MRSETKPEVSNLKRNLERTWKAHVVYESQATEHFWINQGLILLARSKELKQ